MWRERERKKERERDKPMRAKSPCRRPLLPHRAPLFVGRPLLGAGEVEVVDAQYVCEFGGPLLPEGGSRVLGHLGRGEGSERIVGRDGAALRWH